MSELPSSLPGKGRSVYFPYNVGDDLDGSMIRELATGGEYVTVTLADSRRGRYRLDFMTGGVPVWVLER
ncbi:hypothetical protein [Brachybacterium tyrofermentans]|uniref:hypothetical protein n=1 Tax=Brachybacterium tyrofermentans TaxID=47848 RepID=UPI003F8F413E